MKKIVLLSLLGAAVMVACQTTPVVKPSSQTLGILEMQISTNGVSTARLESGIRTQGATLRENDVAFSPVGTSSVLTDGAFDYLQARFDVTNTGSTPFNNLTLYAVAKSANVAGSAIKSITDFGGVNVTEQARIAKLVLPVHTTQLSLISGSSALAPVLVQGREDFQAFTNTEISALQNDFNNNLGGFSSADKVLGYGFVARGCIPNCTNPTSFSRTIPPAQSGIINLSLRIPKQTTATAYQFIMTFAVVNESNIRVTRSKFPSETLANTETRLSSVGATAGTNEVMQIGLARNTNQSTTRANVGTNDIAITTDSNSEPTSYNALGLERIDLGSNHSCGLNASGQAFCWGSGSFNQLGHNSSADSHVPVAVKTSTNTDSALRFAQISAGTIHTCAVTTDGVAYCWGNGSNGMLGNNSTNSSGSRVPKAVLKADGAESDLRFSQISAGLNHTCAIATDGLAYCWGFGRDLGINATTGDFTLPVEVAAPTGGVALRFSQISAGKHTCGITITDAVFCWGNNSQGELGNNSTTNSGIPVALKTSTGGADSPLRFSYISVGGFFTCGINTSGVALCWGQGTNGKLGQNAASTSSFTPVVVKTSTGAESDLRFLQISAGEEHVCGLTTNARVFCWGQGTSGQLGNDSSTNVTTPVSIKQLGGADSILRFASIGTGRTHTCGMTTDGQMFCWGNGSNGKLGNNSTDLTQLLPTRDSGLSFRL